MLSLDNTESSECDYFGLACYGEDNLDSKTLNQFSITNFSVTFYADTSNKVVKKILFPATIATLDKGKHDKQQKNGLSTLPKTPPGCKKGGVFA